VSTGALQVERDEESGDVRAGIVVTGNEVLNATIRDENFPWLSETLASVGVALAGVAVVPDDADAIVGALRHLSGIGVDLILTTGGLGPTEDDKTASAVATFAGRELVLDQAMEEKIRAILERYARARGNDLPSEGLDAANRKQALVPEGALALDPVGTAPGLVVPGPDGVVVVVLPGPPRELQPMWKEAATTPPVAEVLERADTLELIRIRMFGVPESRLAERLKGLDGEIGGFGGLEVTTCLRKGELEIDIRHRSEAGERAEALRDGLIASFPEAVFSTDGKTIDEIVAGLLLDRDADVSVAESCTAGLLAARLASRPGASRYFSGGVVSYSNRAKEELLGVDPAELAEFGAVSDQVAESMAVGVRRSFGTSIGVGITGVAGPDGGSSEKPVGFVCLFVDGGELGSIGMSPTIPGSRNEIRERSTLVAMHLIRRLLEQGVG
jgi:nicotinamide-nucleotide amidase